MSAGAILRLESLKGVGHFQLTCGPSIYSTPHDDRAGRIHGAAPRRTDRASVAGCGFRKPHLAHSSLGSGDGGRCAENGSSLKDIPLPNNDCGYCFAGRAVGLSGGALLGSYWLLSCDADPVIADSSLKVSAYFLPPKSILVSDWLPSSFVRNSVASLGSG